MLMMPTGNKIFECCLASSSLAFYADFVYLIFACLCQHFSVPSRLIGRGYKTEVFCCRGFTPHGLPITFSTAAPLIRRRLSRSSFSPLHFSLIKTFLHIDL
jgi:hypothetical protein